MSNSKLGFDLIVLNKPSNYRVTVNENDTVMMMIPADVEISSNLGSALPSRFTLRLQEAIRSRRQRVPERIAGEGHKKLFFRAVQKIGA